jgi:hypothetical protein
LFAVKPISKGDVVAVQGGYMYDRARRDLPQPQLGSTEIPIAAGFIIGPMRENAKEG